MQHGGRNSVGRRQAQRGEGKASTIFWLLFFVAAALIGKEYLPVKIATMQLKDHAEEVCQRYPEASADFFRDSIYRRAIDLDLPVEKKHIGIRKTARRVVIEIEFPVTLDFLVTEYVWTPRIYLDRDIFLI